MKYSTKLKTFQITAYIIFIFIVFISDFIVSNDVLYQITNIQIKAFILTIASIFLKIKTDETPYLKIELSFMEIFSINLQIILLIYSFGLSDTLKNIIVVILFALYIISNSRKIYM